MKTEHRLDSRDRKLVGGTTCGLREVRVGLGHVRLEHIASRSRVVDQSHSGQVQATQAASVRSPSAPHGKRVKEASNRADNDVVKRQVLVIEDSASVRRLIEVCLRVLDVDVAAAEDGIQGLDVARDTLPDVIVLDIGLPGMDGWEVLRHLRSAADTQGIKVLVLTAHAQPEVAQQADEVGADDFMTKPFRPGELRERLEKLLADV